MYTVPPKEGLRLGWVPILLISSLMLVISLMVWGELRSSISPYWQQAPYWEQQAKRQIPLVAMGVDISLVLIVLRGRMRGWSNRSLQRLIGLLVVTALVGPLVYMIWSSIVLSRYIIS